MGEFIEARARLLIIGSTTEDIDTLRSWVRDEGHDVRLVPTAQRALEEISSQPADLILLATELPDMDGLELCRRLKATEGTRETPVLLIREGCRSTDSVQLFAAGGTDYLTTPLQPEEVRARIEPHLRLAVASRSLFDTRTQLEHELAARRQVEDKLLDAEQSGLSLLENLNEVVYAVDDQGVVTYVSPTVERLLGYSPAEVESRPVEAFFHPRDIPSLREGFQDVLCGRETTSEYRAVTKSGEVRWVRTSSQPLVSDDRVIGAQGVLTDITASREAEEQIREQHRFLTSVLESLTHPFYVIDASDHSIHMANSAAHSLGWSGSGTCYGLTHGRSAPCDAREHPCPLTELKRTRQPVKVEHTHYDADGNQRHIEVHSYPLFDSEGNVARAIEYALDVTERKQAEESLRRSEKRYRQLLDALQEGIWVIDRGARTTFVNPRMAEMLGYTVDEMLGRSLFSFMDERDAEIARRNLERRAQGIREQHDFEFLRHDGSRLSALLETSPVYDDDGKYVGAIAGVQDITQRRQAEDALQRSRALLQETQRLAKVGGWELDLDSSTVTWTEEVYRIHELSPDFQPTLDHALGFYHPDDRPVLQQAIGQAIETGEPWDLELRFTTTSGRQLWVRAVGKAELQEGKAVRLSGTLQDVTERRQSEDALRESEQRWRSLTETSPDHIVMIDTDLRIQFANFASPGLRVDDLIGTPLYAWVDEERQADIKAILENVLRTGTPARYETVYHLPDGGKLYYESHVVARTPGGSDLPVGLTVSARDITERRQVEDALHRSRTLLQETQRLAQVGGWELDLDSSKVVWTEEVYRIHELPTDFEPTLDSALAFYHPDDRPMLQQAVGRAAETGEPWDLELRFITATGRELWVRAIGKAEIQDGRAVRLSGTFQDITERKQAEGALQEAAVAAERTRLARDLHDSVTQALFSAGLVAEVLPQVWQRDPDAALEGLDQLRLLTRGALAEMRTMLLELRPSALTETKLNVLLSQLTEAVCSRTQLEADVDAEPIAALPRDVHITFYRVAQEALHNVVKHAGASRVTVRLRASPSPTSSQTNTWPGQIALEIIDDGQGFEPRGTEPGQMGLGIMRERVESIGGTLTIETRSGRGTRVWLGWPGD
jgi:PAS domain S-box-containing protein